MFCVLCVNVYCSTALPTGVNTIAVNKYIKPNQTKPHHALTLSPVFTRSVSRSPGLIWHTDVWTVCWSIVFEVFFFCRWHPVVFLELKVSNKVIYRKIAKLWLLQHHTSFLKFIYSNLIVKIFEHLSTLMTFVYFTCILQQISQNF